MSIKYIKHLITFFIPLFLFSCNQEVVEETTNTNSGEYRFERTPGETPDGYALPLTGKPITKTPIVIRDKDADLKEYPSIFVAGTEELDSNEIRITCLGSGNPPVRIGQAATGWLVECGNGENFIFDCGGGTTQNLWSLGIPPAELDKLFLTHLHLDHAGGILPLFDAMGWARNTPLRVWGSSGSTASLGLNAFCQNLEAASNWHIQSKMGVASSKGMRMDANEFDYSEFSIENPEQMIYNQDGVKIFAFPVVHLLVGAVGYRLEYRGLSFVYTGDSEPTSFEAERAKNVDVFAHEMFIDPVTFSEKNNMPLKVAKLIAEEAHTSPKYLGQIFSIAKPRLGVCTHFFVNDDTIDPAMKELEKEYNGPTVIAQDLMVINVSANQIVTRMAMTDRLMWAKESNKVEDDPYLDPMVTEGRTPDWLSNTKLKKGDNNQE